MGAGKKRSLAKSTTARRRRGQALKPAHPPADDPGRRHEELNLDRRVEGERLQARLPVRKKAGRPATAPGPLQPYPQLRLDALGDLRRMAGARPAAAGPGAVPPAPGASNWVQLGPTAIPKGQTYSSARVLVTGRVTAIVVDPTDPATIYLGAAQGGVWKTTDGGKSWAAKSDHEVSLAIGAVAMDPANRLVLYVGTGEGNFSGDSYYGNGVLKTQDGGDTWATLAQGTFTGTRFSRIAITPGTSSRLFAATGKGLYRSTDAGLNWTQLGGLPTWGGTDVVIDPTTPTTAFAAFYGGGAYRTTNADAGAPVWTKLAGGLPTADLGRIALGLSSSNPLVLYALIANDSDFKIARFYRSTDGGNTWTPIALPNGDIGAQGFYNLAVNVDPATPDIVYLSATSLWKATRDAMADTWTITDIGGPFHPDNHCLAFDPNNHLTIYAGSDGGIYRSTDGGATWSDTINAGPCITQFEFVDDHPSSDAVVFGGTQDNGTEQFRNSPVFAHADDGDGGFCAVDHSQPRNVVSTYYSATPKRSTQGGLFGSWVDVSGGIQGSALFYPPLALDQQNSSNIAIGTDRVSLDSAQGTGGWPTQVALPGIAGMVSAIHYVSSTLIYAGTTQGEVYRLIFQNAAWSVTAIHAAPLPNHWVWDVVARPDDANTVIVVMSGFGIAHVWRGVVPPTGGATVWTDVSGTGVARLPDIPGNALAIDSSVPNTYYIATDVAVFRTTDAGTTWSPFSEGLPNCAVFDLRLHGPSRLLRAATHGRGLWERRLDTLNMPDVDIFLRDNLMDTGRTTPAPSNVPAAFEDPLQYVSLGDSVFWWQCADIKVDALEGKPPAFQMAVSDVDYIAFESRLQHCNPQRGNINRVYAQVHNRGRIPATNVTVKLMYADASAGLPPLPNDFWTAFPGDPANTAVWKPIGAAKVVPSVSAVRPEVLAWDWNTPMAAADHSCVLAVMECAGDPIPQAAKLLDVNALVRNEKRVGLKNLHVVNVPPRTTRWTGVWFRRVGRRAPTIRILPVKGRGWNLGILLPKAVVDGFRRARPGTPIEGLAAKQPTAAMLESLKRQRPPLLETYDLSRVYVLEDWRKGARIVGLAVPEGGVHVLFGFTAPAAGPSLTFTLAQEEGADLVGGNTFVLRVRARA